MADKKASDRAKATSPVDASQIPQDSAEKPDRETLVKSGYVTPEHWDQLERGEPIDNAEFKSLEQVNREADEKQAASNAHSVTATPGTRQTQRGAKADSGPSENKSEKGARAKK
jgi:hypothetical protein